MNKNNAYQEALGALSYSQEQKDMIAANAAAEVMKIRKRSSRLHFPFAKIASVAACLVCVLTLTAEAAGIPTPVSRWLGPIFGNRVAQTEVIDSIGIPLDAYDTDNGITIRAEAVIGDAYNTAILFSITRDDGEPILPEDITVNQLILGGWASISKQEGGAHGASRFLDPDPGDNSIQYLMLRSFDMPMTKEPAVVQFTDLKYLNTETEEPEVLYEGKWRFRFEVDYEDTSLVMGNNETFMQEDMLFTITEVRISPIAIRISYEVDSEVQWSDAHSGRLPEEDRRQQERYMENVSVLLVKKDGTIIDMSLSGGSIQPKDGKTYCTKSDVLPEIVPLAELDRVIVGDVEYPLQ